MRLAALGLALGLILLGWLVHGLDAAGIGQQVMRAGWAVPAALLIHAGQLAVSALAWRVALEHMALRTMLRVRWIREAVNSLLPVAQIGGPVVGAGLLTRAGVPLAWAGAATTLDLMMEAVAQLIFTVVAVGIAIRLTGDVGWFAWMAGGLSGAVVALAAFVVVQRAGGLRLIEVAAARLTRRWPGLKLDGLRGLHADLMRLQRRPGMIARGVAWHTLSWAIGGAEVWVILRVMGHPVSPAAGVVIEAFGMMARSVAFAVPGAVGVQEGGFVLAAGLFGVPPDAAVALSVVKRLREFVVGVSGMALWFHARRAAPARLEAGTR